MLVPGMVLPALDQRVTTLLLAGNQLQGAIPPEIGNLTRLQFLDLRQNALTGAMPIQIGNLLKLTFIDLSRNRLSGAIPPEIGNLGKSSIPAFVYKPIKWSDPKRN